MALMAQLRSLHIRICLASDISHGSQDWSLHPSLTYLRDSYLCLQMPGLSRVLNLASCIKTLPSSCSDLVYTIEPVLVPKN
jgi:hypothetical protein